MLDIKAVGLKICKLRKTAGYSQEKLAQMLHISAQAISKWENGHTLPDTSLLPMLSQIFECTIDDIIMPGYVLDTKIENQKISDISFQTDVIAEQIAQKIEKRISVKGNNQLDDDVIVESVRTCHGVIGGITVERGKSYKENGQTCAKVKVITNNAEYNLLERVYGREDIELHRYGFVREYVQTIPQIYHIDFNKKTILMEDLSNRYIPGYNFDENNDDGENIRSNYEVILSAVAEWHKTFWENNDAFGKIGLDWRLESQENILAHLSMIEKDFKKYRKHEESGKIPKTWETEDNLFENHISPEELDYFENAIAMLKAEYPKIVETRFHTGKNITIIHGDLHPGQTFLSRTTKKDIKFKELQALRMGLCTEDLAMLIALHIEPDKAKAEQFLKYYYQCLCEEVKEYSYEMFMNDYKIAIMENMFFTIRLLNRGLYDFEMRDRAIKAYKTFVLDDK